MMFLLLVFIYYFIPCSNSVQITNSIFPIKYDLTLTPFFETESHFKGSSVFYFRPLHHNKVSLIELHADNLNIHSYILIESNKNSIRNLDAVSKYDKEKQLLSFNTGRDLLSVERDYELHINYSGTITNDGWGLYKGSYQHNGKQRYYVITQLRPIYARRILPCLDEPHYKSRFTVRIWRLPQYIARSNMPCIDTSPRSLHTGRVLDTFAETPPMSTFLLALTVFDFESIVSSDKRFFTWAVPDKIHLASHGHLMVPKIVNAMEIIAGFNFTMPKLDQIAVPRLLPVAMENWGMNTYREEFMMYKEGEFTPKVRQDVPRFTGHEVAHHWLGNLVTLQWWDWLWLSEMYAMYYEYYLPSQVEPSWRMADQMVIDLSMNGLLQDSFNTTLPLTTKVSSNEEILGKFSGVAYTKGPALVRMIDQFLTHPRADQAFKTLLHEKKYGTVNPNQLWDVYERYANGLPTTMEKIMSSWTDQPGYPLVNAIVDQIQGTITLTQERFYIEDPAPDSSLWWIPITFTLGSRPCFIDIRTKLWLTPQEPFISLKLESPVQSWVLLNIQHNGFYRVNYDNQNWERLILTLLSRPSTIHELNRAQLLDDSFNLARSAKISYTVPLHLASYLKGEACYFPWAAVMPSLQYLLTTLNGYQLYDTFKEFIRELIAPVYNSVGFQLGSNDSHLLQMNRIQIVSFACFIGIDECVQAANLQENLISEGKQFSIAPGLESIQICTVLESGKFSQNILQNISILSREDQIKAIPCVADKGFLVSFLNKSLHEVPVFQWKSTLKSALTKPSNVDRVLNLLISEKETLLIRFTPEDIASFFIEVGEKLSTKAQLLKLKEFQSEINETEVVTSLRTVCSKLTKRLRWIEHHLPEIESWFLYYKKNRQNINKPLLFCS